MYTKKAGGNADKCRHGAGGAGRGGAGTMVQMLLLSPGNSASVFLSVCNHFYSCDLQLHSLHRKVRPDNVFYAHICTKQVQFMAKVLFYGAYVVCDRSCSRCSQQ